MVPKFANMTTIRSDRPDLDEDSQAAVEALLPWLNQFDGYCGMIVLTDGDNGRAHFVTFWEDEDALKRSAQGRQQVREQMAKTAGAEIESSQPYAVRVLDGFER
jgi:quinol monooxygenase YgiN